MSQSTLTNDIDAQANSDFDSGRTNHITDLTCSICAVLASFVASILAAGGWLPAWVTATFAALPGLFATLQRVVDFRGRAAWYFLKASKLRGISLALRYEDLKVESGSKQYRETEVEMEEQWSRFVKSGQPPATKP